METAFGYGGFLQQRERGERDRLTSASSQRRREGSRKQISRARKCDARARARPTPTTDRRSERTRSQDVAVQRETVTGAWAGTLGSAVFVGSSPPLTGSTGRGAEVALFSRQRAFFAFKHKLF
jgi:hypothetical protein